MTFLFSSNRLKTSRNFVIILIFVIQTCLSPLNKKKNGKLSFLDIEVSRENGKFVTTVYRKPTFSGVYTLFESFLPTIYKFGMVYTLDYSCFKNCSDWSKFHEELSFLKQVFSKNGYPLSFIEILRLSPLTFKKTKPSKESAICDHLLNCNNIPSFEEFTKRE